jgi:hypothetical protein
VSVRCAGTFDVTADRLEKRIGPVAESVVRLDQKFDRTLPTFALRFGAGSGILKAMIKCSHAELDRRLRALEEAFADLQARVERPETSTH